MDKSHLQKHSTPHFLSHAAPSHSSHSCCRVERCSDLFWATADIFSLKRINVFLQVAGYDFDLPLICNGERWLSASSSSAPTPSFPSLSSSMSALTWKHMVQHSRCVGMLVPHSLRIQATGGETDSWTTLYFNFLHRKSKVCSYIKIILLHFLTLFICVSVVCAPVEMSPSSLQFHMDALVPQTVQSKLLVNQKVLSPVCLSFFLIYCFFFISIFNFPFCISLPPSFFLFPFFLS